MLRMTAAQLADIARAAEAAFPVEACGLLIGTGSKSLRVTRIMPAANLLAGQAPDRFELDPAARFQAERETRGTPERVIGHWHSHPNGSALPSSIDLAQAWEPELVWLIVGIAPDSQGHPRVTQTLAHRLNRDSRKIRRVPFRVE